MIEVIKNERLIDTVFQILNTQYHVDKNIVCFYNTSSPFDIKLDIVWDINLDHVDFN